MASAEDQIVRCFSEGSGFSQDEFHLLYPISCMHCMILSPAADGLEIMWGREKTLELLQNAGFRHIQVEQLPHDVMNDYYIVTK